MWRICEISRVATSLVGNTESESEVKITLGTQPGWKNSKKRKSISLKNSFKQITIIKTRAYYVVQVVDCVVSYVYNFFEGFGRFRPQIMILIEKAVLEPDDEVWKPNFSDFLIFRIFLIF